MRCKLLPLKKSTYTSVQKIIFQNTFFPDGLLGNTNHISLAVSPFYFLIQIFFKIHNIALSLIYIYISE